MLMNDDDWWRMNDGAWLVLMNDDEWQVMCDVQQLFLHLLTQTSQTFFDLTLFHIEVKVEERLSRLSRPPRPPRPPPPPPPLPAPPPPLLTASTDSRRWQSTRCWRLSWNVVLSWSFSVDEKKGYNLTASTADSVDETCRVKPDSVDSVDEQIRVNKWGLNFDSVDKWKAPDSVDSVEPQDIFALMTSSPRLETWATSWQGTTEV